MMMEKTKVLVVDDSALIRNLLSKIVNAQPDMVSVGGAPDPLVARDMIKELRPDVLTLDIEMPRMDGLEFLEKLMRLRPMPVVMVSTLTESGAEATMRALELGAVDFVAKPRLDIQKGLTEYAQEITDKIRVAARAKLRIARMAATGPQALLRKTDRLGTIAPDAHGAIRQVPGAGFKLASTEKLILIGASTGGTEAIREVLTALPPDSPGILITQHMPAGFTKSFADRLNKCCALAVKEAEDGERVLPGHAYIAPGSHHLLLRKSGANYVTALSDAAPVNRHRPSVEVLFRSGAEVAGPNIVGVMLTGMGKDGALAMREMRDAGSWNVVQDEASCVVFGMPREAIAAGAADEVMPLKDIAAGVIAHLGRHGQRSNRV
jgi:two-component system chemotaxis response regulator CheB